jgi:DNA-binding phage protein
MLQNKSLKPHNDSIASACLKALAESSKALKAFSFYPESHPLRRQILDSAYSALAELTSGGAVALLVQRNGFALPGDSTLENNPVTRALAQELFVRELQRVTFLPDISPADFSRFLSLLTLPPQKVTEEGGMGELISKNGIQGVVVNQIDISAVYTKKNVGEAAGDSADGADPLQSDRPPTAPAQERASEMAELSIEELFTAMAGETEDGLYRQLSRRLLDKAQPLKQGRHFDYLFKVAMALVEQSAEQGRSAARRECAAAVVQQLCSGEMTAHLLDHLEDPQFRQRESVFRIMEVLGTVAVDGAMTRLLAARSNATRKSFSLALVRIGTPALPSVLALLKDGRWQVVFTAVAILGEMGNRGAVKALALTLHHPDTRVRKEAIRVLAKLGGTEATALLLSLVADKDEDQATALQAITWLGQSRNQMALQPLIELVQKRDVFGKSHPLKKQALLAIGQIGERHSLDLLFAVVRRRGWITPGRQMELKLAALAAIAAVGGEPARNFLRSVAGKGGQLGRAAGAGLEALAKKGVSAND